MLYWYNKLNYSIMTIWMAVYGILIFYPYAIYIGRRYPELIKLSNVEVIRWMYNSGTILNRCIIYWTQLCLDGLSNMSIDNESVDIQFVNAIV